MCADPYLPGRDDTVLKWKPLSMNSVDFKLKIVKGMISFWLYKEMDFLKVFYIRM